MAHPDAHTRLVGRDLELAALDTFVHTAEATGSTLLLIGEPGVGKSALLASAAEMASADGTRVVHGSGLEYETDVSFAGLHQLVGPLSEDLRELPVATRTTIEVALGIGSGPAPDRLAVMNAALELFRCAAARTPLLVFIDDMHWLDRSTGSVIGFVGRRLGGCRMGLLGATRPRAGGYFERAGLPELDVGPLTEPDAMTLLTHQFAHLPTRVLREVAHEAQGNPLALLEFATAAGGPQGAHPQASSAASATGREVRSLYEARVGRLPEDTRRLLLLAALEGSGSLAALATANAPYGWRPRRRPSATTWSWSTTGPPSCDSGTRWSSQWSSSSPPTRSAALRTSAWPSSSPTSRSGEDTTWPRLRTRQTRTPQQQSRPAPTTPSSAATSSARSPACCAPPTSAPTEPTGAGASPTRPMSAHTPRASSDAPPVCSATPAARTPPSPRHCTRQSPPPTSSSTATTTRRRPTTC